MVEENYAKQRSTINGIWVFIPIWFGQLVSVIGSGVTAFALGIWVYQQTGSVTNLALTSLSATLPSVIISPIAGVFVDRWNRKWIMLISDLIAGLMTGLLALMLFVGNLEIWHIYLVTAVHSICTTFQEPAYMTAMTLLVPKQHLARVNGQLYLGESMTRMICPMLAGVLIATIKIQGIILFDLATFVFALVTLLYIRFPKPKIADRANVTGKSSLLIEVVDGWRYIKAKPGILGLMVLTAVTNFMFGTVGVLSIPLVISFASVTVVGILTSISGSGMLFGSLTVSIWGGSQRNMKNVFFFMSLNGLCLAFIGLKSNVWLVGVAAFIFFFGLPIINSSINVILQRKVMANVQGRVFGLTAMISKSCLPLAYLVAGSLADNVFKPLMPPSGSLAGSLGQIIGVGPGRGIGLMFIVMGMLTMIAAIFAYQYRPLRLVEKDLPDI
ncbi:Major Facilitator Superfamily transporter (plasmid) [Cylindrospermum stagnale PCC 7417]|uniref:Major Facilitator Superfamily transporter n=1 Tax=Cylindrospermum stagnale PCC 7417 TaxID=56107 RepID=K9X852_9NOST|nr:MFS transporter [Cylindrospermum stagnale]AFZ28251.1 Major Facilitator Superfamily transporter [Cylindrospermum stagnale PCC 7417]